MKFTSREMIKINKILIILTLFIITNSIAQSIEKDDLQERLKKFNINEVQGVRATPYSGLLEVSTKKEIIYIDKDKNLIFFGRIFEIDSALDVTERDNSELVKLDFNDLPLHDAIKIINGNGERQLAAFLDVDCMYCGKIQDELKKINNITIYVFVTPILSKISYEKSKNIWCAPTEDRSALWLSIIGKTKRLLTSEKNSECDTPLERNLELSKKFRMSGTPLLILSNNHRIPGYRDSTFIEEALQKEKIRR